MAAFGHYGQRQRIHVRDHYRRAIREIMAERNIQPPSQQPGYVVSADTGFMEVVQHTHWYVDRANRLPHYRYRRYREILDYLGPSGRREAHIDVGCGAGLFSWAFLDWATYQGLGFDRVDLYGLDHCPAMINLAREVRNRLMQDIANYPHLHYAHDVDVFLQSVEENHRTVTDYTITFGHVLVQAHAPHNIQDFARVIAHVYGLMDDESNCVLMAVDARRQAGAFAGGWDSLLNSLGRVGVHYEQATVPATRINDHNCAKVARLYLAR